MNQQHHLIHSTAFRRAAASGEPGHASCFGCYLQSCPQHDWLPLSEPWGSALWGAEQPHNTHAKAALDVLSVLPGINTCFPQQIDLFWPCCLCTVPTPALGQVAEGVRAQLLMWASVFGWDVSWAWPLLLSLCATWGWLCPSAVEIGFLPPCISQAFPGDWALQNMMWPWSQSYYDTLKVILSLQIYEFMPFC